MQGDRYAVAAKKLGVVLLQKVANAGTVGIEIGCLSTGCRTLPGKMEVQE